MPRISSKSRSGSLEGLGLTIRSGHASTNMTIVSSIVSAAVDFAGQQILASVDPKASAPNVNQTQQAQLEQIQVVSSLQIPDLESGVLVKEVKQTTETIEIVQQDGAVEIAVTTTSGSEKLTETVSAVTTNVEVKLVAQTDLLTIHDEFIKAFLQTGPFSMGSVETYTELWNMLNEKINELAFVDTRLLIYRDTLDALLKARDVYVDNIRADKEITTIRNKYNLSQTKVYELMEQLALLNNENGLSRFCGSLGIKIKQPKPLIYAQALFNINMAWHIYLHGTPIDPRMFKSTIAYVNSLGGKDPAYQKLITLLDEYYKDEELEMDNMAQSIKDKHSSSSEQSSSGNDSSSGLVTSETCSSSNNATSDSNYSSSEVYTSDSEHYCSDDDIIDNIVSLFNSTYKTTPLMVNLFGQENVLVLSGSVSVDVFDKYEETRRKYKRNHKSKNSLNKKVKNKELLYIPLGPNQGGGNMLVIPGAINMDLYDRFEKHETNSKTRRKIEKARKKKTNSRRNETNYERAQRINSSTPDYKLDPYDQTIMLILGGELGLDIKNRFETYKHKTLEKEKKTKKSKKKKRKKTTKNRVKKGHTYWASYMNDYFGDTKTSNNVLILDGCFNLNMTEQFTKFKNEDDTNKSKYTEACGIEIIESSNDEYTHPGSENNPSILSKSCNVCEN